MSNVVPFPRRFHTGPKGEFVPPANVYQAAWSVEDCAEEFDDLLNQLDNIPGVTLVSVKAIA